MMLGNDPNTLNAMPAPSEALLDFNPDTNDIDARLFENIIDDELLYHSGRCGSEDINDRQSSLRSSLAYGGAGFNENQQFLNNLDNELGKRTDSDDELDDDEAHN